MKERKHSFGRSTNQALNVLIVMEASPRKKYETVTKPQKKMGKRVFGTFPKLIRFCVVFKMDHSVNVVALD